MAISRSTASDFGGAVSDLFAGFGSMQRARGAAFEAENYEAAAEFADQNVQFTKMSTGIKQSQSDRELYGALGQTTSDVSNAGFDLSGSALDILRSSAQQGAMTRAVLGEQGLITEEGYRQQAASYRKMAGAARIAENAHKYGSFGQFIGGGIKAGAGIASIMT